MKKIFAIALVTVLLAFSFAASLTVSAGPTAKGVTLDSANGEIAVRSSDDIKELFDGEKVKNAEGVQDFNLPGIVLIQNTKTDTKDYFPTCDLVIDLGEEIDVNCVNITFYHYFNAMIGTPDKKEIVVSCSDDGEVFAPAGTYEMENEANDTTSAGIYDEYIILDKSYKCRYVKVSMTYGATPTEWSKPVLEWFGFTELSAGPYDEYLEDIIAASEESSEAASSEAESEASSEAESAASSEVSAEASSAASAASSIAASSAPVSSTAASSAASDDDASSGFPTWAWIAIGVGVVAIVAAVIVIIKKKKA